MNFVLFETSVYYEVICEWWLAQGWPCVALSHLPTKGCGVFLDDNLVAAAFLYINGTALSNFEWIVVSPKVRRAERTEVINCLITGSSDLAKQAGVESIFMSTRHESLISRLEKNGFQKTDLNMTNLVRKV